jgi:hypothetical protein
MFENSYIDRMLSWRQFRETVNQSRDPLKEVLSKYNSIPTDKITVDPYTQSAWPGPWELLMYQSYCVFAKLLGVAYTLQLTERFSESRFEIHIYTDYEESQIKYFLSIDNIHVHLDDNVLVAGSAPSFVNAVKHTFILNKSVQI